MADYNQRFGRTPKNAHDAHRPLRSDEDPSRIFSWQEERTMSRNLVVHFKRVSYLVEPGPETLPFAGKRVRVFRWDDGRVEIRCAGRLLPASPFDKNRCVDQGAIVENKRLGAVLSVMQARSCSVTRHACAGRKSPFGRRSASWLLTLRLGHRRHPQTQPCRMASVK